RCRYGYFSPAAASCGSFTVREASAPEPFRRGSHTASAYLELASAPARRSRTAARPEALGVLSDPAADDVEHRREDEAEGGDANHAEEHGRAERLPEFRARPGRDHERHHTEHEGERRH